ncbi:ribosome hibernation-promoting factor, HPF/YfiA family [Oceanospirillum beijerinckii]|uniref:ribosome hibernation-promoting factor, HPF/YfiA family n=1 Tax=Oceanospirillum beijerinckii TaxID=64976 RepID=UPI0004227A5F|nr:ribosome-associated translation inhibitor RaiA [Oceanospirillum beijerinckii]
MQLNITGQHLELTDALRDYVSNKVTRLERHVDGITNVQVTLKVEKERQIAEATLHVAGADLHATAEDEDMYASIGALTDKIDRQLIKHKEKAQARKQGAAAR